VSQTIAEYVDRAQRIVVVQADNPDGDSLASSLALEQILGDMGKDVYQYCGVDIPTYLRHLPGWDRVNKQLPSQFDLSIIVDTSAISLLEQLQKTGQIGSLTTRPSIVIDHHPVENTIYFSTILINKPAVATGELLYELVNENKWPMSLEVKEFLAISILSDSLGLMSEATTGQSIHIMAELVESGVSLAKLESARRETMRKSPDIVHFKGELLQRVEYFDENRIAAVTISHSEIAAYSHEYNPSMLVLDDMRLTTNTDVAIAFKTYADGKITAKIRCNYGKGIATDLAQYFGGGGHPYASGFKVTDKRPFTEVKTDCINKASELLRQLESTTQ